MSNKKKTGFCHTNEKFSLWNLNEILRHVDRPPRVPRIQYPNSYLKLPLLKFEMLTMRACAPDLYEENLDAMMHTVKRKVHRLMKSFKQELSNEDVKKYCAEYQDIFLESMEVDDMGDSAEGQQKEEGEDLLQESKTLQNVPNRKQIKAQSAKIVEELSKKED